VAVNGGNWVKAEQPHTQGIYYIPNSTLDLGIASHNPDWSYNFRQNWQGDLDEFIYRNWVDTASCVGQDTSIPTATPTITPTPTITLTPSRTPSPTITRTPTPSSTPTPPVQRYTFDTSPQGWIPYYVGGAGTAEYDPFYQLLEQPISMPGQRSAARLTGVTT
jgi:hypothetical protein